MDITASSWVPFLTYAGEVCCTDTLRLLEQQYLSSFPPAAAISSASHYAFFCWVFDNHTSPGAPHWKQGVLCTLILGMNLEGSLDHQMGREMEKGVTRQNDIACFSVDTWCHRSSLPESSELFPNISHRKVGRLSQAKFFLPMGT